MMTIKDDADYEEYVLNMLAPKYKNIWRWKNIPKDLATKLGLVRYEDWDDIKCDILAELHNGKYHYVECKNGMDSTINMCDLEDFYNFIAENRLSKNAYVYYSGNISHEIISKAKQIKYINMPMINSTKIVL
jgi:hypothetical protein